MNKQLWFKFRENLRAELWKQLWNSIYNKLGWQFLFQLAGPSLYQINEQVTEQLEEDLRNV
jgi:hypothetical protein